MSVVLIVLLSVALMAALAGADRWVKRRSAAQLRSRPAIPFAEIHEVHYVATGVDAAVAQAHWSAIAQALECDETRMRPQDRLGEQVGRQFNTVDQFAVLEDYVAHCAREYGLPGATERLLTVDDCMRYLIRLTLRGGDAARLTPATSASSPDTPPRPSPV